MAYTALNGMNKVNRIKYGLDLDIHIPSLPKKGDSTTGIRDYGIDALEFLRDDCVNLKFDKDPKRQDRIHLTDSDGCSVGMGQIPYNMERDLDRLSFERALLRFLKSGSREDAFDIYYCYCEIFHPFGDGYVGADTMLRMLSDHESNASSLLMKHRDHYSHSVYVFCIGLAIYKNHEEFRKAYNDRFGLKDAHEAACHFLEYWGLTSLFHDIGYPFEIAHQQMKTYVCKLDKKNNNEDTGFAPHISYKGMEKFCRSRVGDLNDFFAESITNRLAKNYLPRVPEEPYRCCYKLRDALKDRAVHNNPDSKDYLYMDHAYFSGLVLAKAYLEHNDNVSAISAIPEEVADSLCAIILHNSLFKFTIRNFLKTKESLQLNDGQPLAYLLMLCDELQCWDRICYGKDTRRKLYPCDFDMKLSAENTIELKYFFEKDAKKRKSDTSILDNMGDASNQNSAWRGSKRSNAGRSKFLEDINKIVELADMIGKPYWNSDEVINVEDVSNVSGNLTLSNGSYLSLYQFAVALHRDYRKAISGSKTALTGEPEPPEENAPADEWEKYYAELWEVMEDTFEKNLSLEYKLSNIAQAKHYARILEKIHCFYTDREVNCKAVTSFSIGELDLISREEHKRWCKEKQDMGWMPGNEHLKVNDEKERKRMRECTRRHDVLGEYKEQTSENKQKNADAMKAMLDLLYKYDGLTIYRLPDFMTEKKEENP